MKHFFLCFMLISIFPWELGAQIRISSNQVRNRHAEISATLIDSLTRDPVPFASVYLIPERDTSISNFTLSDPRGKVLLEEVPYGKYHFCIEILGYRKINILRSFSQERINLGEISLSIDPMIIEAARISVLPNSFTFKKDTLIFNAVTYQVRSNDVLRDLILRMPGLQISSSGTVIVNGTPVKRISVGGKTFFFENQSAALENLPASIIEKIRIINQASEIERATEVKDFQEDKILDIELKKEFRTGIFGHLDGNAGTESLAREDELRSNRPFLYGLSGFVSAYQEKDQWTAIGQLGSIHNSGSFLSDDLQPETIPFSGIFTGGKSLGLNYYSDRIRDVATTAMVSFGESGIQGGERMHRTIIDQERDLTTDETHSMQRLSRSILSRFEFVKETGNIWFHLRPDFAWMREWTVEDRSSISYRNDSCLNSSSARAEEDMISKKVGLSGDFILREFGQNKARTFRMKWLLTHREAGGDRKELSSVQHEMEIDCLDLSYCKNTFTDWVDLDLQYTEPVGERIRISFDSYFKTFRRKEDKKAFSPNGLLDDLSALTTLGYWWQNNDFRFQYRLRERDYVITGATVNGTLQIPGPGKWNWFFAPYFWIRLEGEQDRFTGRVSGGKQMPSYTEMVAVPDYSQPANVSFGNPLLTPSLVHYFSSEYEHRGIKSGSVISASCSGRRKAGDTTWAVWYDSYGVRYSLPVNALTPSWSVTPSYSWSIPVNRKKDLTLSINISGNYSRSFSYICHTDSRTITPDTVWGHAKENRLVEKSIYGYIALRYKRDRWSTSLSFMEDGNNTRFSSDPDFDSKFYHSRASWFGAYSGAKGYEWSTSLDYDRYDGAMAAFMDPALTWDCFLEKTMDAFTICLSARNILDQRQNRSRIEQTDYLMEKQSLCQGRCIILGFKWNFGKMNPAQSMRANAAALGMPM